ncbi:MAG: metallophosphoesterase [Pseudomonadota bacterium]
MIIAQISDTHIALDAEDAEKRIWDFEAVIADINLLDPLPDLIVHTGDIVHNGLPDEYAKAVDILSEAKVPVYAIVGNKDNRTHMRETFADFGFLSHHSKFIDYMVDDLPVKLIMLDTLCPDSNMGDFCPQRLKNLDEMISGNQQKPVAVFMHHPPCETYVGPHLIHFENRDNMLNLRNMLKQTGNVISIFCGHVHRSTVSNVHEIPVTVMTAVATTLRWGEYSSQMRSRPTYHIHRFDKYSGFVTETRIVGI